MRNTILFGRRGLIVAFDIIYAKNKVLSKYLFYSIVQSSRFDSISIFIDSISIFRGGSRKKIDSEEFEILIGTVQCTRARIKHI